jgi:hypothetical protein
MSNLNTYKIQAIALINYSTFFWPPTSQTTNLIFLTATSSILNPKHSYNKQKSIPIVGIVWIFSFNFNLYKIEVLPAAIQN